jgi:hypothetical protein
VLLISCTDVFLTYFDHLYQALHKGQSNQKWKAHLIEKGGKKFSTKKGIKGKMRV